MTIEDVFPGGDDTAPPLSNPCFEGNAGFLYCDGTTQRILDFPGEGDWVLSVGATGVLQWKNATAVPQNAAPEAAPQPRGGGGPGEQVHM